MDGSIDMLRELDRVSDGVDAMMFDRDEGWFEAMVVVEVEDECCGVGGIYAAARTPSVTGQVAAGDGSRSPLIAVER